jgi:hypothetical protein
MRINIILFLGLFFFVIWGCSKSSSNQGTNNKIPSNIVDLKPASGDSVLQLTLSTYNPDSSSTYPDLYYYVLGPTDTLYMDKTINDNQGNIYRDGTDSSVYIWSVSPYTFAKSNTPVDTLQFMYQDVSGTQYGAALIDATMISIHSKGYSVTASDTLNLFFDPRFGGTVFAEYSTSLVWSTPSNFFLDAVGYISFRIRNNNGSRYGWIKASSSYPGNGNLINIYEIAFNKNYNVPIAMGEYQ